MGRVNELSRNAVLVLAGGRGRRMGGEKLTLAVDSELILARVLRRVSGFAGEILLSVAPDQVRYVSGVLSGIISQYGIRTVVDAAQPLHQATSRPDGDEPLSGPLVGIVSGLEAATSAWVFVCACDMPFVSEAVVRALWKEGDKRASVIVPFVDGYYEPLHAFYNKSCLPEARSLLAAGRGENFVSSVGQGTLGHAEHGIIIVDYQNAGHDTSLLERTPFLCRRPTTQRSKRRRRRPRCGCSGDAGGAPPPAAGAPPDD